MKSYGFRTTNLILHFANAIVLFLFLNHFVKNKTLAIFTALLFAIHPVNTETVSITVSRNNILVTFFSLLSFYFYILNKESSRNIYLILSVISFSFSVISKEFGVMLLPILFLYNRFYPNNEKNEIISESIKYVPFVIILVLYLLLRYSVIGDFLTPFGNHGVLTRIYFLPFIIIWNLRLILLPYNLHQMDIAYPGSLVAFDAIISIVLFFFLCLSLFLCLKRGYRLLLFSGLSFLIALFPVLHIISSASTPNAILALRWLYFPFSFLSLGLAFFINIIFRQKKRILNLILITVLLYLGSYSFVMNRKLWHNEKRILSPGSSKFW